MRGEWGYAGRLGCAIAVCLALGAIYFLLIRPGQLRWGATRAEVARAMPEDSIVAHPDFDATRAITIHGRPEQIWPWLAQMGFRRAGFYGYDLIENAGSGTGIRSAESILPQFQHPRTGDVLPLSVAATLEFGTVDPNHCLVWRGRETPPAGVFVWELVPVDDGHTRLISRIRWRYVKSVSGLTLGVFTEFADHVAVRAILRGIRDRVEGRAPQSLAMQALKIGCWIVTALGFVTSLGMILFWRRWRLAVLLALGAGLLLQFELYATFSGVVYADGGGWLAGIAR